MVSVRAARIIKALEYELKWKHDFFETFLKHFFKHDFRFKNMIFPILYRVFASTLSLWEYDTKNLFNVQFLPTVSIYSSANSFDATLLSLKIFPEIFVTLQRRLSKIMQGKGLKLSSSFYFADYDQLKSSFKQQIFARI